MSKIKMKAKAGVTLVELLVVILIVTILSVSLLPLLKPYIEKAKYAAEPIPVIANLQTKIELYQYEHTLLPGTISSTTAGDYYTWFLNTSTSGGVASYSPRTKTANSTTVMDSGHLQDLTNTDWQDLTGKNMRPSDFQYAVTKNEKSGTYCYAVGVFGGHDSSGLAAGTGYAVCKVVDLVSSNKVVAIWERYKANNTNSSLEFRVAANANNVPADGVLIPQGSMFGSQASQWTAVTNFLSKAGWSF